MNPYNNLSHNAFWKKSVAELNMFNIKGLWNPKFNINPSHNISTYGSCFAQHIGRALKNRGFNWYITETGPNGLSEDNLKAFNYNIFSSRTGNIYTTSLLKQWVKWSMDQSILEFEFWEKDNRFVDPFRPRIEPNGFKSKSELLKSRKVTLEAFKKSIVQADIFVFTLGLTESWFNNNYGYEYPMCPGTVAGKYVKKHHEFKNQQFEQVIKNLSDSIGLMKELNKNIKFILTVSPVPLTATMSGNHVLTATIESKSILRAVAGQLASNRSYVDYFPSYEIINSPVFRGGFFEPNQRNVTQYGVNFVMNMFFQCLNDKYGRNDNFENLIKISNYDEVCEEELLQAFSEK